MKEYKIEIQSCISTVISADSPQEAREYVLEHIGDYAEDMLLDCYVGDAKEVKKND